MTDQAQLLADIRANALQHIETCRLLETRVVDAYCCALPETGEVLCKNGIRMLPVDFGAHVERNRSKAAVNLFLKQVRQQNPDNATVQRLVVMGWKKAARLQRQNTERMLATLDERGL